MSAWPTLREWFQFGGTLALELVIVFAVAKLVALRVRSAQGRRALWQITLLAMLLVSVGELSGVRGWLRLPEKKTPSATTATQKVIVTLEDVEPGLDLFPDFAPAAVPPQPVPHPSRWQQHTEWPALLWTAGLAVMLLRLLFAQIMATVMRLSGSFGAPVSDPARSFDDTNAPGQRPALQITGRLWTRVPDAALGESAQRIARTLGIRRPVALLNSTRTIAPFTFGVWRPVIVLPKNFSTTFTREQQDAALAHELAHVAGFDSAWRTLSQSICAVLWWHPLAWLAKRELDHASELVADEASLLVANGPDRLAECLLACAKELRRPALAGWLGMDGGGFRSALGKRVTRLLQLNPHARLSRPVPWYLRLLAPVVCAVLLWLGMAAVMKSNTPRNHAWHASILGSAFAAVAENKTPAPVTPTPTKVEALPGVHTNTTATRSIAISPKRQAIYDQLRSIRLSEWGPLESLPLSDVIRGLADDIRRIDPERKGLNFIISGNAVPNPGGVDAAGLPNARTNEPVDLNAVVIRLGTAIKNPTLEEALNIVMKIADRKIKYSVEDYGVLISPAGNEPTTLHTRFFHMNSNDFQRVLQSVPRELTNASAKSPDDVPFGRRVDSEHTNRLHFLTEVTPAEVVIPGVRNWFKSLSVDLTEPGKTVFYNDKLTLLMVRATLEDLDMVEKGLQTFGIEPKAWPTPRSVSDLTNSLSSDRTAAGEPHNVTQEMQIEAAKLVQDGKIYYETGQMHAARTNLQAALRLQPSNQGALYYLDLVNAREQAVRARLQDSKQVPLELPPHQAQEASTTNLQTRLFRVDPNTFFQGLDSVMPGTFPPANRRVGGWRVTNATGGLRFETAAPPTNLVPVLKSFLQAAGVDLSAPGRSVFYNDRVETIMVRASATELGLVEKALQLLNMSPPQLTIRVKVFEIAKTNAAHGFDWFLGTVLTNPPPRSRADPNAAVPTITGILTEWQFRDVVRALEKRGGTDMLNGLEVTTLSGRQAQIKVVDIQYVVTDLDIGEKANKRQPEIMPMAEPFELGPKLDVIPYVQPDGYTIQMTVIPSLKEFLGYEDPKTVQPAIAGAAQANGVTSPMPLPKFRLRQVAATAMVWDGQTLMVSAGSARTMQRKPDANGVITTNYTEKELIYFITPRLIDAAGNPLHADGEFPERHKTVPGQPVDSVINEGRRNVVKP